MSTHTGMIKRYRPAQRTAQIALVACLLLGPWLAWGSGSATFSIRLHLQSVAEVNVVSGTGGVPMVKIGHTGTPMPPQVYVSGGAGSGGGTALRPTSQGGGAGWSMPLPRSARDSAGMVMTLVYM